MAQAQTQAEMWDGMLARASRIEKTIRQYKQDVVQQARMVELIVTEALRRDQAWNDLSLAYGISETLKDRVARYGANAYPASEKQIESIARQCAHANADYQSRKAAGI